MSRFGQRAGSLEEDLVSMEEAEQGRGEAISAKVAVPWWPGTI